MLRSERFWIAALLAFLTGVLLPPQNGHADTEPLFQFPQSTASIHTAAGHVVNFRIWTADRPNRQEQGLMFVRELDDHAGMLFVFPDSRQMAMWMKNTYISLDMLFLDSQGRIDYIAARTKPLKLDLIQAPRPVSAVLELKGGITERLGIHVGDKVVAEGLGKAK
jgi:uncharacterized membrane protein (UPF0127 family)